MKKGEKQSGRQAGTNLSVGRWVTKHRKKNKNLPLFIDTIVEKKDGRDFLVGVGKEKVLVSS